MWNLVKRNIATSTGAAICAKNQTCFVINVCLVKTITAIRNGTCTFTSVMTTISVAWKWSFFKGISFFDCSSNNTHVPQKWSEFKPVSHILGQQLGCSVSTRWVDLHFHKKKGLISWFVLLDLRKWRNYIEEVIDYVWEAILVYGWLVLSSLLVGVCRRRPLS